MVQGHWLMRGVTRGINCVFVQKADGTCNTNFKTTKTQEQVLQVFVEFIEGNTTILVSLNSLCSLIFDPFNLLEGHTSSGTRKMVLTAKEEQDWTTEQVGWT